MKPAREEVVSDPITRVLVLAPHEDQAERAVALAAELAARGPVDVILLRVLEEGLSSAGGDRGSKDTERIRDLLASSEAAELERLAEPLRSSASRLTTSVRWGAPWEVVLELVSELEIDLVVKPARGLSHEGSVFFGATALHLFRKCPCPVWVVGDSGGLPRRLLAAIDPTGDHKRRAVGRRILDWSRHVARVAAAELELVSCWHAPAADILAGQLSQKETEGYRQDALARAREGLEDLLGVSVEESPETVHLVEGDARDTLSGFVDEGDFDLVVMGTLGREGLAGEILGETAELVVRAVRSSVLTVSPRSRKPAGS